MQRAVWLASFVLAAFAAESSFGGAGPQASDWVAPPREARKKNPLPDDAATIAKGKEVFLAQCVSCHGETGVGDGPAAKDLEKHPGNLTSKAVQDQPDGALFWKVSNGRAPMTAFQGVLTPEQRWAVVRYVKTLGDAVPASVPKFDTPEELRKELSALFDAYDACRAGLARGDDDAAKSSATAIGDAVESLRSSSVDGLAAELAKSWREGVEALAAPAAKLGEAADLKARRAAFQPLSTAAENTWEQFGHSREAPLVVFKTADGLLWVQGDGKPSDPYDAEADVAHLAPWKLLAARRPEGQAPDNAKN